MQPIAALAVRIAPNDEAGEAFSLAESWDHLVGTLAGIWRSTIAHLPAMMLGALVLLFTWLIARFGTGLLESYLDRRNLRRSIQDLILRFVVVGIWVFGSMIAAMLFFPGLTPTKALGVLGLGSVAVGFAFKDVFENFLAGVMILWRFPFDRDDTIECEGIKGRVEEITIRNTMIRRPTDELVVVPNATLFKNPVDVLTNRPTRRISVIAGVAYDVDVEDAIRVIEGAVRSASTVASDQDVQVFAHGFGASSVDIEVAWWTDPTPLGERRSRGEVVVAVKRALDDAGIEIPFPYRTLTFKEPLPIRNDDEGS